MLTVPFYPLIKIGSLRTLMENWINKVRHTPYRAKNEDQFFRGAEYIKSIIIHYLPTLLIGIEHQVISHLLCQPYTIFLFYNICEQSLISRSTAE